MKYRTKPAIIEACEFYADKSEGILTNKTSEQAALDIAIWGKCEMSVSYSDIGNKAREALKKIEGETK